MSALEYFVIMVVSFVVAIEIGKLIDWAARPLVRRWAVERRADRAAVQAESQHEERWRRRQELIPPSVRVLVRLRDGDNCRFCGVQVHWTGRLGPRRAVLLDTGRVNGRGAGPVVSCRGCREVRECAPMRVLPEPATPRYTGPTAAFLAKNGHPVAYYEVVESCPGCKAEHEFALRQTHPTTDKFGEAIPAPDFSKVLAAFGRGQRTR